MATPNAFKRQIQAHVTDETRDRIQRHPLFSSGVQLDFLETLILAGLASPEFAIAEMVARMRRMENDLENLRSRDQELSDGYRSLEVQHQGLAQALAEGEGERNFNSVATEVPEGTYIVVIDSAYRVAGFIDLNLRIEEGSFRGRVVPDRVRAVPAGVRTAKFAIALGLAPEDLISRTDEIVGKRVLLRRVKGSAPDDTPRMLCFYNRLAERGQGLGGFGTARSLEADR